MLNITIKIICIILYLSIVPSQAELRLVDENSQSLILELTIPEYVISEKHLSGTIHIPGYTQGKSQLPVRGTLIAVPEASEIQLEILDSEIEFLSGILLPPEQSELPTSPVKIGLIGHIREQRVAQIQFFPVLHNPVQQTVKLYKKLRVKVSFSKQTRSGKVVEDSPEFDTMLNSLLINDATSGRLLRTSTRTTRDSNCEPLPPAIKLSIDKTGVYALSHADFLALGLDLSLLNANQVSQIQMSHQGHPVSIFIAGEDDGVFDQGDILFFYAQAAKEPYTRNNIYWLSLNPDGGKRLNFKDGTPNPSYPPLSEFTQTVHVETNSRYWSRMPDSINRDRLFWEKLDPGNSLEMPITLQHLAQTSKNATLRVMLQGKTDDRVTSPNHHTKILLNGVEIHDAQWSGQQIFLQEVSIPQAKLLEGKNTVTLLSVGDTGAIVDVLYVNWLEIDYTATMTAVEDHLTFKLTGVEQYNLTVNGFTHSSLLVLDVTNPFNIVPLLGATGTQIQYADQLDGNKTYYAFSLTEKHLLKPAAMSLDLPTTRLQSPCNQADYFIIYHDSFDTKALENLIAARGKKVMAVQVSDIYDEFNHGLPDPQAIKDFLTYAYENYIQPRPVYVLLVGDANQDTLNELGNGINYVPTHTFHTVLMGETASDNWFVSVHGDDPFPDMFLGRIPVKTQAELDAVVKKLIRYPKVPLDGWEQNVLFVADDIAEFEKLSDSLIEKYLANYSPTRIYLSTEDETMVRQKIRQAINAGAVLTNYTGHGSVNLWAGEIIFNFEDVALLNNPDKLTFVVALNCQNGWFSYYEDFHGTSDSLAEAFLKADGKGAIGMFAPSGLGYTFEHEVLANELFKRLFQDKETEIGSLTTASKIAAVTNYGISTDNLKMFTLFGEPSLRLRLE
ncbi:hypothetical protein PN36_01720 [Candidatus Thiomargarita nelsonii]|uniref:Gingipain domain-containing protein n=1 Tax=Candidatus Thiomargarita nelsonii TaxID=1003181 RepID=A0A0A6P5Z8_9GAMM|nr:hypothetical protein PN36_01720 [Candidatus Thiomargarita nelsonii]